MVDSIAVLVLSRFSRAWEARVVPESLWGLDTGGRAVELAVVIDFATGSRFVLYHYTTTTTSSLRRFLQSASP